MNSGGNPIHLRQMIQNELLTGRSYVLGLLGIREGADSGHFEFLRDALRACPFALQRHAQQILGRHRADVLRDSGTVRDE